MPPVGFEPTIAGGERPQTYALDRAATGTGCLSLYSIEMKEGGRSIRDLCKTYIHKHIRTAGMWWHAVEVHRCKLEDRGFVSFRPHCDRGVDSASNGNEYQEYFLEGKCGRCVRLTTLPPSFADCPEIWEPQPPATQWACNRPVMGLL